MRIGGFPQQPQQLPRQPGGPGEAPAQKPRQPAAEAPTKPDRVQAADFDRVRENDSRRFYSTHRDLPHSGRMAMETYLTNASLNFRPGESELLGIDLYA